MKKVAVLGANGQLGKTIHSLVKNSLDTYSFFSKSQVDITNKISLEETFRLNNFDYCINCAAYTNVDGAEQNIEDAFSINATGVKNLAEVCQKKRVKLIHISTDYVFDGTSNRPYKTDDETSPINQYGKSKQLGESYIQQIIASHYIIRTSWLYSAFGKNFVKTIVSKINDNVSLKIINNETGTPTSCVDLAKFILFIITNNTIPYGIYNFSARGQTNWYEFAREIINNYYPEKISNIAATDDFKTLAVRPKYSVLDLEKTENVYKQLNPWEKSLKEVLMLLRDPLET